MDASAAAPDTLSRVSTAVRSYDHTDWCEERAVGSVRWSSPQTTREEDAEVALDARGGGLSWPGCSARLVLQAVLFDFLMQSVSVNSQTSGCPRLYSLALPQNLQDQFTLYAADNLVVDFF